MLYILHLFGNYWKESPVAVKCKIKQNYLFEVKSLMKMKVKQLFIQHYKVEVELSGRTFWASSEAAACLIGAL